MSIVVTTLWCGNNKSGDHEEGVAKGEGEGYKEGDGEGEGQMRRRRKRIDVKEEEEERGRGKRETERRGLRSQNHESLKGNGNSLFAGWTEGQNRSS